MSGAGGSSGSTAVPGAGEEKKKTREESKSSSPSKKRWQALPYNSPRKSRTPRSDRRSVEALMKLKMGLKKNNK